MERINDSKNARAGTRSCQVQLNIRFCSTEVCIAIVSPEGETRSHSYHPDGLKLRFVTQYPDEFLALFKVLY